MRRGFLRRWLTVSVIPHGSSRVRQLSVPSWLLALGVGGVVAVLGAAGWVIGHQIDYDHMKAENRDLTERVQRYESAVAEHRMAIERVTQLEEQLRELLKAKNRRTLVEQAPLPRTDDPSLGRGGPTLGEQNSLDFYLAMKREAAKTQLERDLLQLEVDSRLTQDGYHDVVNTIRRQRSIQRATPCLWPASGTFSSPFGPRDSPTRGVRSFHAGIDIAGRPGDKIRATADGIVVFAGWGQEMGGYGKVVVIDHGFGYQTRYAHNQDLLVSVGQKVRRGQVISYMGSTGESTGPHCHYEVRMNGKPLNPMRFIPASRPGADSDSPVRD